MVPLTQGLNSGVGLCSVAITYSGCEESRLHVFCWKSGDEYEYVRRIVLVEVVIPAASELTAN